MNDIPHPYLGEDEQRHENGTTYQNTSLRLGKTVPQREGKFFHSWVE